MLTTGLLICVLSVQTVPSDLSAFLQGQLDFSPSELIQIGQGEVVTKQLYAETEREIALVGVTRLSTTKEQFLEEFRRVGAFLQSEHTTHFKAFSRIPQLDDLSDLTVNDGDLDAIRDCRMGDCDVNLSEAVIGELQRLNQSAETYRDQVSTVVREALIAYVRRYLAEGDSALVVYDHKREPLSLADGFRHLLAESPYLLEYVPELHGYVKTFPRRHLSGVEDRLYWTVEEFGMRPLTSVTHATIFDRSLSSMPQAVIMLKQIYASHYFHAALKVMGLMSESPDPNEPGLYLFYLDRSLYDTRVGGIKRRIVERELRQNLVERLESIGRLFAGSS